MSIGFVHKDWAYRRGDAFYDVRYAAWDDFRHRVFHLILEDGFAVDEALRKIRGNRDALEMAFKEGQEPEQFAQRLLIPDALECTPLLDAFPTCSDSFN